MTKEKKIEDEEELIKEMILDADFEEEPPELEDFIESINDSVYIISDLMVAIADKMGIDTKEILGELHPDYEDEEED